MKNIISSLPVSKKKRNIANVQNVSDSETITDANKNDVEQIQSNSANNEEKNNSQYKESKVRGSYKKTKNYINHFFTHLYRRIFNKDWCIKQIPYLLFLMFLIMVYINNIYSYNILLKELYNKKEELKVTRIQAIHLESQLKSEGKNNAVYNKLEEVGSKLEVITEPIVVVE
ncbi:MAG: FtsL-like putative cell division protein [Candidatus Aphodosoma sp.]